MPKWGSTDTINYFCSSGRGTNFRKRIKFLQEYTHDVKKEGVIGLGKKTLESCEKERRKKEKK